MELKRYRLLIAALILQPLAALAQVDAASAGTKVEPAMQVAAGCKAPAAIGAKAGTAAGNLAQLRTKYAAEIDNASTFKTIGVDRAAADNYLMTADGQALLGELRAADPGADASVIYTRAIDQIASGSNVPVANTLESPLVKIVPQGQKVSKFSPYFTTNDALQAASKSGYALADCFGLPLKSEATAYDIYQIAPTGPAKVFVSDVAPTSELGGLVRRPGGAVQYLVPNRSAWSSPTLIGTIENRKE